MERSPGRAGAPGSAAPAPTARPRRPVCVLERNDFADWRDRHARGEAAGALPYGLEALGERFELLHADRPVRPVLRPVVSSLEYRADRQVGGVLANVPCLRRADACLSIFEDFGLTYSWLARVMRLPPMVLMACWMTQRLLTFAHQQRAAFRRLVDLAGAVTVFSANQVPVIAGVLGCPAAKLHVVPFGVVTDYFVPAGEPRGGYVAVAGQDIGRDWPTMFAAAAAHPELRFRLAAWPTQVASYHLPANVELLGGLPSADYRELLQHADVVVVASHPLPYPTGQSVLLEALACGRPVVATRTPAMREYLDHPAVASYEAGDAADLARTLASVSADRRRRADMAAAARVVVLERFDSRLMWARVAELLDAL